MATGPFYMGRQWGIDTIETKMAAVGIKAGDIVLKDT